MSVILDGSGKVDVNQLQKIINNLETSVSEALTLAGSSAQPFDTVASSPTDTTNRSSGLPQVSGLRAVPNVGTVRFEWNTVNNINILRFEVMIAETAADARASTNVLIKSAGKQLYYTYQEGDPDQAYFVRVRVINTEKRFGPWSNILNTQTGTAVSENIDVGAVINLVEQEITSFSPATVLVPQGRPPQLMEVCR